MDIKDVCSISRRWRERDRRHRATESPPVLQAVVQAGPPARGIDETHWWRAYAKHSAVDGCLRRDAIDEGADRGGQDIDSSGA